MFRPSLAEHNEVSFYFKTELRTVSSSGQKLIKNFDQNPNEPN